jgi:GH24 family phage-related lysozyme (muramidase)
MIDFKFIQSLEGNETKGYVPDPENSNSGVTIASGFDLGQTSRRSLQSAFPESLCSKLMPYVGMKKIKAQEFLKKHPLEVTQSETELINDFTHSSSSNSLQQSWENSTTFSSFEDLGDNEQTVIASVHFQYGSLSIKTPNFWKQVTAGDWVQAVANLRNFGDRYSTRRGKEADILEKSLLKGIPK